MLDEIQKHQRQILKFRDARDWKQFHLQKNLAISLALEAAEVLELFQWTKKNTLAKGKQDELASELADVYYYLLLLAHEAGIDLGRAFESKMAENRRKYSVRKSRGNSRKYTEL